MDRYEMEARIGEGTFGIVYRAKKKGDPGGKRYAVKKLKQRFSSWQDVVIEREVQAIVRLMTDSIGDDNAGMRSGGGSRRHHHRNGRNNSNGDYLVRVYEILRERDDSCLYFVMEHMPGGSLHDYITEKSRRRTESPPLLRSPVPISGRLLGDNFQHYWHNNNNNNNNNPQQRTFDDSEARSILFQAFRGLCHVHAVGLIHRDIKPENILLDDERRITAKLADFSLTRPVPGTTTTTGRNQRHRTSSWGHHHPANNGCWKATGGVCGDWNGTGSGRCGAAAATDYVGTRWYRAPELLRTRPNHGRRGSSYSEAIDMFSMGCVAAELHRCRPLFRGRDEAEQLALIEDMLRGRAGPMPPPGSRYRPARDGVVSSDGDRERRQTDDITTTAVVATNRLKAAVPTSDPRAVPFLFDLLRILPEDRPTAEEVLSHPYFERERNDNASVEKYEIPMVSHASFESYHYCENAFVETQKNPMLSHARFESQLYHDNASVENNKNPILGSILRARRTRQIPVLERPNRIPIASPQSECDRNNEAHKRRRPLSAASQATDSTIARWQAAAAASSSSSSIVLSSRGVAEAADSTENVAVGIRRFRKSDAEKRAPINRASSTDLLSPFPGAAEPPRAAVRTPLWKRRRQKLSPSQIFNID